MNHLGELGWLPQEYSSKEDTEIVTAVGDLVPPETPNNVIASNGTERIKVEWDKVTKNADDSDCNDLSHYNVYYSSSSGIDTSNDSTYDGVETRNTLTWSQEVSPGNTKYYVVTTEDDTGNESSASSETSATSQAVSITLTLSDYVDNFDNVLAGDGIIGLVFRRPSSTWNGFSHYKLYRDENSGSSWTSIYEGPNPAYIDKGLSTSTAYKYKLTLIDIDGNETDGTVRDNSSSGYTPNNSDNSNLTGNTFLAQNIVAVDEVRGADIYAGSSIEIGTGSGNGYIKSKGYSAGSSGWKIDNQGNSEFNDVTVRGEVDIDGSLGGSDISNTLSISGTIEGNYSVGSSGWQITGGGSAEFNNVTVRGTIDGSSSDLTNTLSVSGNISCASGNVQLGQNVGPNNINGISVQSGGKIQITDFGGTVVFDSSGYFRGAPRLGDLNRKSYMDTIAGQTEKKILDLSSDKPIAGGQVLLENNVNPTDCYIKISDSSGSYKIYHITDMAGPGATRSTCAPNWGHDALFWTIPAFQPKGSCSIYVYNADTGGRYFQYKIWYT